MNFNQLKTIMKDPSPIWLSRDKKAKFTRPFNAAFYPQTLSQGLQVFLKLNKQTNERNGDI